MKIVSINIEKDAHLERVIDFVQKENPDVVCMQEVMESTFPHLMSEMGMYGTFVPFVTLKNWGDGLDGRVMGIATFSREPHTIAGVHYYQGTEGKLSDLEKGVDICEVHKNIARAVLAVRAGKCVIGTTHFTYTCDGEPDEAQRKSLERMLKLLEPYENLVLCGDFNIPRPNELYEKLKEEFTDNVPSIYHSSLDSKLHRVPGLERMVDYVWTRGGCEAGEVHFVEGVSDHCAVVTEVG